MSGKNICFISIVLAMMFSFLGAVQAATITSVASEDAYVNHAAPASNYGALTRLHVRGAGSNSEKISYLKFDVSGVTGTVQSATLKVWSYDCDVLTTAYEVSDISWTETGLTWNNRPALGQVLESKIPPPPEAWVYFDVSSVVSGNGAYAFALTIADDTSLQYKARESNRPPELLVNVADDWQIIEDTGYPTNDLLVAAVVMDSSRLPADPANEDCAAAFNAAFADAASMGGGFVYAPEGQYLFENPLDFPRNVVLRGAWGSVDGLDQSVRGTILKVTYNGSRSFIRLEDRAGLHDLTIWYPEQSLSNVIPYEATIDGAYSADGVTPTATEEINIKNVNMVNAYIGLAPQCNLIRANVRGLYGSPLSLGMYQKDSNSVPRFARIYFSAEYWAESLLPQAPAKTDLQYRFGDRKNAHIRHRARGNRCRCCACGKFCVYPAVYKCRYCRC